MEAIASYSFKTPPPKDGCGMPLPQGSDIPRMRPALKATKREMIQRLDDALELLAESDCSFWACEGPTRPRPMTTCCKCQAMRHIAAIRATLNAQLIEAAQ